MIKTIKLILLVLNSILVTILSLGAGYFLITPIILGLDIGRMPATLTQNVAMQGLWIFYFISVAFLILSKKYVDKKLITANILFLAIFIFFVILITGILPFSVIRWFFGA